MGARHRQDAELLAARILQTVLPPVVLVSAASRIPVGDLAVYYAAVPLLNSAALFELGITQQITISIARGLASGAGFGVAARVMRTGLWQMGVFWAVALAVGTGYAASRGDGRYTMFSYGMALAACAQFLLTLLYSVEEGFGRVGEVARIRLLGSVTTNGLASVLILRDWGILAYPLGALLSAGAAAGLLWWTNGTREALRTAAGWVGAKGAGGDAGDEAGVDRIRYAVSTICAYVSFQTPALWLAGFFAAPVFTAWAMTTQVTTTIASIFFTPIQGQANVMAGHLAAGEVEKAKAFYRPRLVLGAVGALTAGAAVYAVILMGDPTGRLREVLLLPPGVAAVVMGGSVAQFAGFSVGTLSRAFGRESQMEVALAHSLCSTALVALAGQSGDLLTVAGGMAAVHALVLVGGGWLVLRGQLRAVAG